MAQFKVQALQLIRRDQNVSAATQTKSLKPVSHERISWSWLVARTQVAGLPCANNNKKSVALTSDMLPISSL